MATLALATTATAKTVVVGNGDNGGYTDGYVNKYQRWARAGIKPAVSGQCWSACTYVTLVPGACAMPGSKLHFHQARWKNKRTGKITPLPAAVAKRYFNMYPAYVRAAINAKGGISFKWTSFNGSELLPICKE